MPLYVGGYVAGPTTKSAPPCDLTHLEQTLTSFRPASIRSGFKHFIVAGETANGKRLYGFGKGENGRLGVDWHTGKDEAGTVEIPTSWLPDSVTVKAVACGRGEMGGDEA